MVNPVTLLGAIPPAYQLEQPPPSTSFEQVLLREIRSVAIDVEKREVSLDALIAEASSGRHFTNAELLVLQAKMHKYSLEIDLVSKVVQQAVQGLRDLLRTQV